MVVTRDVAPGIHRLGHPKVNWYLLEDSGRFTAVDAGLPGFRGSLESDLATLGVAPDAIEAVILTHSDADHTGLAGALHDTGARVFISATDEPKLRRPGAKSGDAAPVHVLPQLWRPSLWGMIAVMAKNGGGRPPAFAGAQKFSSGDVLDVPGEPRVIPTPGHTPGHCAFHFEGHRALFVGDAMCTWNPVVGRRGPQLMPRPFNESNDMARQSLDALEPIDADIMLFGHGDPWTSGVRDAVSQARALAG
jgi:glyoxylase-like metal-dependent hydrolase (beta-lactamase superfamily II)